MRKISNLDLAGASALILAVFAASSATSETRPGPTIHQPDIQTRTVPIIEASGLRFRDLD